MRGIKRTTQSFIADAIKKHGNKYDYSLVNYTGADNKVTIICDIHGEFQQTASAHLYGRGCAICNNLKRFTNSIKTNDQYIKDARLKHGDIYDYSTTNYTGGKCFVTVKCKVHGCFKISSQYHLEGGGCSMCLAWDIFLSSANRVHGDKYDYSLLKNIDVSGNPILQIICRDHGVFKQRKETHLNGHGCKMCYKERTWLGKDGFIERANGVHGYFYDYSSVEYKNINEKVKIICPTHGLFSIRANHHLSGGGCVKCNPRENGFGFSLASWLSLNDKPNKKPQLYLLNVDYQNEKFYKVGITSNSVKQRYMGSKFTYPFNVVDVWTGEPEDVYNAEKELKRFLKQYRYTPRLCFEGRTECFNNIPQHLINSVLIDHDLTVMN